MIRKTLAVALLAATQANAVEYNQFQPERSQIAFTSKQMGVAVDGRFRKFAATLSFDPARPAAASARIDIELASIDAGSKDADDEVVGKQWFNTKTFPTASFVAAGVKPLGGDRYEAVGKISIKGRSQDAVLPFTVKQDGRTATFDGSLVIKRLDFAIGEGPWADVGTVANEVQVKFRIVAAAK
ncbi:YceI family protein [Azospira restricta]|uniref:YceI family protein n=1 Tax=Azospira restricta TaxID=404405 RepID=A0A974SP89_9RHOO|nr:YceI family protein [Azospira restricta]QRJ63942.1 YceI family protein [Azospira restricta]